MVLAVCLVCVLDWIMVNARIDYDNDNDNDGDSDGSSMCVDSGVDSSSSVGGGGSETGS